MPVKNIKFREQVSQKILKGVRTLAGVVKVTLGPRGRNVAIDSPYGAPKITKDGVTVAKEVELEDRIENMGAQIVYEAASKTSDRAGDGTTSATVIAEALCMEGMRNVAAGSNPRDIKRGVDKSVKFVLDELQKMSRPIQSRKEIEQIATISSNNDSSIGETIAQAMEKVGKNGTITVEEGRGLETVLDVVEGMSFDRGYLSSYFVTDEENQEVVYEGAYLLICDKKVMNIKDILPLLQTVVERNVPLGILAEDVEGEALTVLVANRVRGLKLWAMKAPGFGDSRKERLKDIAILTGGTLISEELGIPLDKVTFDHLGKVDKVVVKKDMTTIVGGGGNTQEIQKRIALIKKQIEESTSDYDREKLQERLAKLSGGIGVIRVGAATEVEMKEKKDRVDDALQATRAAIEEGIVKGGGSAFVEILPKLKALSGDNEGENVGISSVAKAISAPLRQIADNAGYEGSVVLANVLDSSKPEKGWDANSGEIVNMIEAGIVDPTKVLRTALQSAAGTNCSFLEMAAAIYIVEDKKAQGGSPSPAAMAGMDY